MVSASPRFGRDTMAFLRAMERNNNREWFKVRRDQYEQLVRGPMADVLARLSEDLRAFAPEYQAEPNVSLFRVYRDTRFSRDKSPLKTQTGAHLPFRPLGKRGASLYFEIGPRRTWVGAGLIMPSSSDLLSMRRAIAARPSEFIGIVESNRFLAAVDAVHGQSLLRTPPGFDQNHPAEKYLRLKQFIAGRRHPAALATAPRFYKLLLRTFEEAVRLTDFLNHAIVSGSTRRP